MGSIWISAFAGKVGFLKEWWRLVTTHCGRSSAMDDLPQSYLQLHKIAHDPFKACWCSTR
ncbi:hypothetical protein EIB18_05305 [Caulobacter vibrioides]|nr:hypothetical protein CA608_05055 [Caulobacter vibrioides]AZH12180.1 hypothetical protein EIB18_05305 [Caulobacter vibrioides]PLR15850.1 hypothetical protein CVUC_01725 [Caulobacter vibrioides]